MYFLLFIVIQKMWLFIHNIILFKTEYLYKLLLFFFFLLNDENTNKDKSYKTKLVSAMFQIHAKNWGLWLDAH